MVDPAPVPTLYLICGKIAAGKSTLAAALARRPRTLALAEDDWLPRLYPGEIQTLADYGRCSARLRSVLGPHIVALLRSGLSVVLDFPANTVTSRAWMRGLVAESGAAHELHLLDVPDDVCRARLHQRNAAGTHPYVVSDAEFAEFTSHFVAPTAEEGFNVVVHPHQR
ncbi:MAG: ATP-binding protein [Rhodospirillales bacterium]|nr:MAG: ATP-binding protein [Rhodospirillales bacterium]